MEYHINVKPHIKKFVLKYLNTDEPVKIRNKDVHGKVFMSISWVQKDTRKIKFNDADYPETLAVDLNHDASRQRPRRRDLEKINVYFDKLFKEIMFQWILAAITSGDSASDGIRRFLKYYRISEDDYSWHSAHRAWMRYRKQEYKKSGAMAS